MYSFAIINAASYFNLNETIRTVTKHQLHGVFVSKRNNPYRTQWTIYVLIANHPNMSLLLLNSYKIPKFQEAAFVKKNSCFKNHPLHPTQAAQCTHSLNMTYMDWSGLSYYRPHRWPPLPHPPPQNGSLSINMDQNRSKWINMTYRG